MANTKQTEPFPAVIATTITEHKMVDTSALERTQLFIANDNYATDDASHRNTSIELATTAYMATTTSYGYRGETMATAQVANWLTGRLMTINRLILLEIGKQRVNGSLQI